MLSPKRIVGALAALAMSVFVIYYVYRQVIGVGGVTLVTENAFSITVENSVPTVGYILRSELVLDGVPAGNVFPSVSDGEKVGANREIATVYSSDSAAENKARLDEIDEALYILQKSLVDQEFFSADVEKLRKDCDEALDSVVRSKADNNFLDCIMKKTNLLISMNKLENVTTGTNFDEQITSLANEKAVLSSGQGETYGKVYAPVSGYYSGIVDGYEGIYTPAVIETLTVDSFRELAKRSPNESLSFGNAGKIVTDSRWYVCCEITNEQAAVFKKIDEDTQKVKVTSCDVVFPFDGNTRINMRVEKVISETDKNTTVMVFSTDEMPEAFSYTRTQKIEIISESYSGLKVPKLAMRKLDNKVDGVFVLSGETVVFKRAEPIYEADDWYIVRSVSDEELEKSAEQTQEDTGAEKNENTQTDKEREYKYLSLYDSVIVEGKELYDGKRIK